MDSVDSKEISETLTGTETGEETDSKKWFVGLKESLAIIPVDRDSDKYNMTHPKRGKAVIFNHRTFSKFANLKPREGTEKEEAKLKKCFLSLGFEVDVHHDLKRIKLLTVLDELREEDHSNRDCLVVVVLSHGEHDKVYSWDFDNRPEDLWNPFTADKCPTLAGKPKLFFIQACKGDQHQYDSRTTQTGNQTDSRSYEVPDESPYVIPNRADFLIVFSTAPGYYSWKNTKEGSWFIQTLTTVLSEYKDQKDVFSMMTIVTRRFALDFESYVPRGAIFDQKMQVPMISSTLTRDIWL